MTQRSSLAAKSAFGEDHQWVVPARTETTVFDQLLKNRAIADRDRFLHPSYDRDSHDPFLLPDMDAAIDRILQALSRHERIAVYADYDADGIPGGALLAKVLGVNGADVVTYIPDREREGYGLHEPAVASLRERGVTLIITVDLGITNAVAVTAARARGVDVIVTDHHAVDLARVPRDAVARVHPALPGSRYPFAGLAGGGVAWKLAHALASRTGNPTVNELKWLLDLPAISTVCDMVPLRDENRTIVRFGIEVLRRTRNTGLAALYSVGGIDPTAVTERTIGFQIGPRLNAPGRMDHGNRALELLMTTDPQHARLVAEAVELQNKQRQQRLALIVSEASLQIAAYGQELPPALVLSGSDWPVGLLGLAASRLVEQSNRPVIMLGVDDQGVAKGSGRAIDGFDLLGGIHLLHEHLLSYGGHERAAGLQVRAGELESFTAGFVAYARSKLTPEQLCRTYRADLELKATEITDALMVELELLAPFGAENPLPRFVLPSLTIRSVQAVGAERAHLRLGFRELTSGGIGFRLGAHAEHLKVGDRVDVLGSLHRSQWNGAEHIDLHIEDLRFAMAHPLQ